MPKTVCIIQSNYVPWKGYFDMIGQSDEFIVLDTVQFTKNDWRNRNRIKVAAGNPWLTIPVKTGGRFGQTISETEVIAGWAEGHWSKLEQAYGKSPHFADYAPQVRAAYEDVASLTRLSEVNLRLIDEVYRLLAISTRITSAADYEAAGEKTARVVSLCRSAGASRYISGPAARAYIEPEQFAEAGIELTYMDYGGYPEYRQLHPPFDHAVSVLDLLFNEGADAANFMKFQGRRP